MLIQRVLSYASDPHGLSGDVGSFDLETEASILALLARGFIERRSRTVILSASSYGGNWTELQPTGPTTIVTWHLTDTGRDHWLSILPP